MEINFNLKYNYIKLDHLDNFFFNNQQFFKKTINGEHKTNKHKNNLKLIENFYDVKFPYGKCFPISQFIFYYFGGYKSNYELRCIQKIPIKIKDLNFTTSHWFVFDKTNNAIIDSTKCQFDKLIDIELFYQKSRRANYGFKWFFKNGERYSNVVPCKQVIELYKEYRKIEINEHLEFFYKEYIKGLNKKN